jgi:hypothetical protein
VLLASSVMSIHKMSMAQLERHVRAKAARSENVFITAHAKLRMLQRQVDLETVLCCLRLGSLRGPPEPDVSTGGLVCRMERRIVGRALTICVALDDNDPSLLVITVIASRSA